jgi:hypothetical protein
MMTLFRILEPCGGAVLIDGVDIGVGGAARVGGFPFFSAGLFLPAPGLSASWFSLRH